MEIKIISGWRSEVRIARQAHTHTHTHTHTHKTALALSPWKVQAAKVASTPTRSWSRGTWVVVRLVASRTTLGVRGPTPVKLYVHEDRRTRSCGDREAMRTWTGSGNFKGLWTETAHDNGMHVTFRETFEGGSNTPPTLRSSHTYSRPLRMWRVAASDESGRAERPLRLLKRAPPPRRGREPSRSTRP